MKRDQPTGDLEQDDEMREIFLEEAREVIEGARGGAASAAATRPTTWAC